MTTMPYLSVVAATGGSEARAFVERWTEQAGRHGLSSEVIPVAADSRSRNAGIRRARGEFVLSTTVDTVFSDQLVAFLASRRLQKNRLYRADRYDASRVWAREGVFPLTGEGLRANAADDIAPVGSGIHFGAGWFPATQLAGRTGRFIGNDAEVVLPRMPQPWAAMDLEVEPGPGVGCPPATLQVIDREGRIAAEWDVARRMAVRFWIPPAEDGGTQRFRLRAPQGGLPTPLDLHIFNFRCLLADWAAPKPPAASLPMRELVREKRPTLRRCLAAWRWRAPWALLRALPRVLRLLRGIGTDVFGPGIEYWGDGWSYREQGGGETFRWAAQDAELVVRLDAESGNLAMLVEPGPGVGSGSFVLRVTLPDGTVVGRVAVRGASYVNIPLPGFREPVVRLWVGPEGGASAVAGDSRILGFRVFACAFEAAKSAGRRKNMAASGHWISVVRGTDAVTVDWTGKLRDCQGPIAEMGKPEDLHLHACGNFTLMARDHWFDLRGYPELDLPAADLDALLCLAAHHAGVREEVLPYRVGGGEGEPRTGVGEPVLWIATQMRRLRAPAIFNLDDWGAGR
jgi:hypothetical protein